MLVKLSVELEVEDSSLEELKQLEHHGDRILNLDEFPEIKSISNLKVEEA